LLLCRYVWEQIHQDRFGRCIIVPVSVSLPARFQRGAKFANLVGRSDDRATCGFQLRFQQAKIVDNGTPVVIGTGKLPDLIDGLPKTEPNSLFGRLT
jgi:hypothetical protein